MMLRLNDNNGPCHEIYDDVYNNSPHYQEMMQRYRVTTSPYRIGSFWKEWQQAHSKRAVSALIQRLMPFWCWCKAYTVRFAVCWGEKEQIDASGFCVHFSEELLYETACVMYDNRQLDANKLLTCHSIAVRGEAVAMDAEEVLLTLLQSDLSVSRAFQLADRVVHSKKMMPGDADELRACGLPRNLVDGMLNRKHVPSRRVAASKMLQTMDLIVSIN